jgi:O-antigen ligase
MQHSLRAQASIVVLPATAFLLPPLAVFAPLGAAPLLAVAAVASLLLDWRRCRAGLSGLRTLAWLLAALGLWGTASGIWSIIPGHSIFEGLRFLALSAGGLALLSYALAASEAEGRRTANALMAGLVLAVICLAIERFWNAPITRFWLGIPASGWLPLTRFDRGITVSVLVTWALICAPVPLLARIVIGLAVLATSVVMLSTTALLAAMASLAVCAAARFVPRSVAAAMIAGLVALGIAMPLVVPSYQETIALHERWPSIKWSGIHRLLIWRFAADRAGERPILGWGMDSSRAIPGGTADFHSVLPNLDYGGGAQRLPLHPHDALMQWQLELGPLGLLLGLAIIAWTIWHIAWRAPLSAERRAGALALAIAMLAVGLLSFGIWQSWWLSTVWLSATFFAATNTGEPRDRLIRRR